MPNVDNRATVPHYYGDAAKIVGLILVSFLSGNLWVLTSKYFFSGPRESNLANSFWGRTIIGLIWFAVVIVIVYPLEFPGELSLSYRHLIDALPPTIVTGMLLQLIAFALFSYFGDGQ